MNDWSVYIYSPAFFKPLVFRVPHGTRCAKLARMAIDAGWPGAFPWGQMVPRLNHEGADVDPDKPVSAYVTYPTCTPVMRHSSFTLYLEPAEM